MTPIGPVITDNTRDDDPEITPTWGAHADNGEILGKESLDKWSSEHQELMQYSWPGYLDTRVRGEKAIRGEGAVSHY